jgi:hypothetical protein
MGPAVRRPNNEKKRHLHDTTKMGYIVAMNSYCTSALANQTGAMLGGLLRVILSSPLFALMLLAPASLLLRPQRA